MSRGLCFLAGARLEVAEVFVVWKMWVKGDGISDGGYFGQRDDVPEILEAPLLPKELDALRLAARGPAGSKELFFEDLSMQA